MALALKNSGNAALAAGDRASAITLWNAALDLLNGAATSDPIRIACLLNLALVSLQEARFADCASQCRDVLAAVPLHPKALFRLGKAVIGDPVTMSLPEVRKLREQLAELNPRVVEIDTLLRSMDLILGPLIPTVLTTPHCVGLTLSDFPRSACADAAFMHSADGHCENLLVMLHGLGDSGTSFLRFASSLALPQTCAVALTAPQVVPLIGGGQWFPSMHPDTFERVEWEKTRALLPGMPSGLRIAAAAIALCCSRGLPSRGWPMSRVHLLGFGDGAVVAAASAALLLAAGTPIGSLTVICGALPPSWKVSAATLTATAAPVVSASVVDITGSRANIDRKKESSRICHPVESTGMRVNERVEFAEDCVSAVTASAVRLASRHSPSEMTQENAVMPALLIFSAVDCTAPEAAVEHTKVVLSDAAVSGGISGHSCVLHRLSARGVPRMPTASADVRPLMQHFASALALRNFALESHPDIIRVR